MPLSMSATLRRYLRGTTLNDLDTRSAGEAIEVSQFRGSHSNLRCVSRHAIHIPRVYAGRRMSYVGQHFWARGYFASVVERDEQVIRK
jgi:hypothetical protein